MKHSSHKIEAGSGKPEALSDEDRLDLLIETARKSGISLDALVPLLEGIRDADLATVADNAEASGAILARVWHDTEDDAEELLNLALGTATALTALDEQLRPDPIAESVKVLHSNLRELLTRANRMLFLDGYVVRKGCA